jgi:hypothetical protein
VVVEVEQQEQVVTVEMLVCLEVLVEVVLEVVLLLLLAV